MFANCQKRTGDDAKEIVYFDHPGRQNTMEVVQAVSKRAQELGIEHVVVASNSGQTRPEVLARASRNEHKTGAAYPRMLDFLVEMRFA